VPDRIRLSHRNLTEFTAALLGREESVVYGNEARQLIEGQTVLVTGAGGSIGSELVRQAKQLDAGRIILLDHDESALHTMQLELVGHGLFQDDSIVLADVRDRAAIRRLFDRIQPDIVFHAAAHKHLPLLERYPSEGVKTNIFGSDVVASAACDAGVASFVNISTDKAAQPSSVLGATKRLAEILVAGYSGSVTRMASVRFGNVLGSSGSFLHSLNWQIENGGAVTVTDRDVTRFFMTIPEAAGLVIEAAALARSGETYILEMGEPVRIIDLVDRFVTLTDSAYPTIFFTGLRPGEKLHEELLDSSELGVTTDNPRILGVVPREDHALDVQQHLGALADAVAAGDTAGLRSLLWSLLPTPATIWLDDREKVGAAAS
jgi:FlaA1/EpsC-like NDP-sugar epimerase